MAVGRGTLHVQEADVDAAQLPHRRSVWCISAKCSTGAWIPRNFDAWRVLG